MSIVRTVGELRALLAAMPDDTPVAYRDPNFGGALREDVEIDDDPGWPFTPAVRRILISCPLWEPCE
jgi:hypothetical protein